MLLNNLTAGKAFLVGLGVALVYYLAFFDDGAAIQRRLSQEIENRARVEADIKKKRAAIEAYQTFIQAKTELGARFEQLLKYIPEDFNSNEQTRILVREARSSGAQIVEIKKSQGIGQRYEFYEEILVDVTLEGTYSQMVLFLSNLTKQDKVIVLKSLKLESLASRPEAGGSLRFKGRFSGYRQLTKAETEKLKQGGVRR